ncbi:MarR family winged helix-turn-helix transcriptional regulator [Nocardioides sp. Kera G14]|uniref:MarR family winged helix-turn-helix transcriptional regulator n=1 Tax=Nocardioides sp. Kera G14 TaxID=2884264 RepID=UPI001D0FA968|nr:MarR family transcriptional regulator [Nocardioides sp. Kera G14]UDY22951.1 MarR family transcriptional regulator [Nocardioides sp. Kera G14]
MRETDPIAEAARQWRAHGWEAAADGMTLVTSIVRVHQLLMEQIDATLRPFGLTFARFEALRLLAFTSKGELPMSKLGSLLQVHPTSVTSAVSRLEEQGFARRTPSETDKRVVLATITDSGRKIVEEATEALNSAVFNEPGPSHQDVATLITQLSGFRAVLGDS